MRLPWGPGAFGIGAPLRHDLLLHQFTAFQPAIFKTCFYLIDSVFEVCNIDITGVRSGGRQAGLAQYIDDFNGNKVLPAMFRPDMELLAGGIGKHGKVVFG